MKIGQLLCRSAELNRMVMYGFTGETAVSLLIGYVSVTRKYGSGVKEKLAAAPK